MITGKHSESSWKITTTKTFGGLRIPANLFPLALCLAFSMPGPVQSALSADPQPPASVPLPDGAIAWHLIFNDNFDGTWYDTSNWNPYADWGGNGSFNNGREKYFPSQIRISDGICNLVAEPNPDAGEFTGSYKSGELISARANTNNNTPYKFSFLYGYVEARIKIVNVSGFFGAFWMIPSKENYTYEWEIDILEVLGQEVQTMFQTYHYSPGLALDQDRNMSWTPNDGLNNNGNAPVLDYSQDYHTYGVDWQADHLTFYIDGIASGTFPTPGTGNANIANTPGYILIQQMVENGWSRSWDQLVPDTASSVDTFHIDYVRVWQGTDETGILEQISAIDMQNNKLTSRNISSGFPIMYHVFSGNLFVTTPLIQHGMELSLFDSNGRLVRKADGMSMTIRPFHPGMYLLKAQCGRQNSFKKVLIH